jgi:hypothetical protein
MKKKLAICIILLATHIMYSQCWQSVKPAYKTTYAIKVDGTLWAWGAILLVS